MDAGDAVGMRSFRKSGSAVDGLAPARTVRRWRWRDARLWVGLGLIAVSMVAGARLLSAGQDTVTVWRATRDLAPGAVPAVEPVALALGDAAGVYAPASVPLVGRMAVPVGAGALIPTHAVTAAAPPDHREVTVPVDPLHAPVELASGDVVDVWVTPTDPGGHPTPPRLVLADVMVASVVADAVGVGGETPVVLDLASSDVAPLVGAMRTGSLDLVRVPLDAVAS